MTKRCTNFPTVEIEVAESSYEKSQVGNTDHEAAAEALRHESRSQKTEIISNPQISATGGGGSSRDVGSWGDRLKRLKRMLPEANYGIIGGKFVSAFGDPKLEHAINTSASRQRLCCLTRVIGAMMV
ncbi:hypothetical protein L596_001280 [Steinernema carpocapsae]|uniref:Uncharacterized protein n=1 Tax=Steinernema carpocapsae TaxID=34508 RepID=A0A4U8ULB3_STECR|nr:hypothetical protein L596_001280 [Steinernema carpocapsae]